MTLNEKGIEPIESALDANLKNKSQGQVANEGSLSSEGEQKLNRHRSFMQDAVRLWTHDCGDYTGYME